MLVRVCDGPVPTVSERLNETQLIHASEGRKN